MNESKQILVVDDTSINRTVLYDLVVGLGHIPVLAENGRKGFVLLKQRDIDLILLDILMPEMNGYEVLEQLKEDEEFCHIPVIMITAVDEMESVVRCIEKGADDYLVKPFNPVLLSARINSCLKKKHLHDQELYYQRLIKDYNLRLEEEVRQKNEELLKAHDRLKILDNAKNDFLSLIAHELRTPLTGVLGAAEMVFNEQLDQQTRQEFKEIFQDARQKLLTILDEAILLTRIKVSEETFPLEAISLASILDHALALTTSFARSREVPLASLQGCDYTVLGENKLLTRAFAALLRAAIKFSHRGETVQLTCEFGEETISVHIRATGRTIPAPLLPKFFDVFSIAEPITPGGDLGLDPPVAQRIIKLFGGSVTIENHASPGILFVVTLHVATDSADF